ncbi:di-trans,poly-cis-decaprenylcistransferase [Candidatus Gracilibacteria bacterium]|nr:di-trans,poly-cis-decaprenylcistransferase [Candidatus Gracilibacteria bacterium]MCF7856018.1 di-trans,poly-cis-decaprenylcistransferase [Candidatus Gracilibacteria bacterium]MCF7896427.1 di-trans,poly-cis-decaprenylcistransferase [Candidatus Gracilibacteria bacterium]
MKKKDFHLAIILDGNRRWAKKNHLPVAFGHRRGVENLRKLLPIFVANGISHLTAYALSTENLQERTANELRNLFRLIEKFAADDAIFLENEIRVNIFGELRNFPNSTKKALRNLVAKTQQHHNLVFNLAVGYGSRAEIVRAANFFVKSGQRATEKNFAKFLFSENQPNPDLLIRTGGKRRISNFLLWQLAYAELYFTEKMWPEFGKKELVEALSWFHKQQRTFGK